MPRKRPHTSARLLIFLLALHLTALDGVAARFRGAGHKPIPTISDDGTAAKLRAERASELAAVSGGGGRRKTVKRTKGGLMPWWVRKRLQEHSEPDLKGSTGAKEKPVKAKRKTPNILEVVELEPNERELEVAEDTQPAKSAAIVVEDIPLEAGSWEAEQVATLQNELQALNEVAHNEQLQRGTAAEGNLVSRQAELQDELSNLEDAAAEEGQGRSAQADLLRSEGHDSVEGDLSLIDLGSETAAKKQAAARGRAKKGAQKGVKAKGGAKKPGKAKGQAIKQAAAGAQKASKKQKKAKLSRSDPQDDLGDGDYDGW